MKQTLSLMKALVFIVGMITLAPIALTVAGYFITVVQVLLGPALGALLELEPSFAAAAIWLSLTFS